MHEYRIRSHELRGKYFDFFEERGHVRVPAPSMVPENDPTALFIAAGMQPLVPYLLGERHPAGVRLVNVQKCFRTNDIDIVGNATHLTFVEMLGNWSLGDYGKAEMIPWSWEFLTGSRWLGIDPSRLYVTVFAGDAEVERDLGIDCTLEEAIRPGRDAGWGRGADLPSGTRRQLVGTRRPDRTVRPRYGDVLRHRQRKMRVGMSAGLLRKIR